MPSLSDCAPSWAVHPRGRKEIVFPAEVGRASPAGADVGRHAAERPRPGAVLFETILMISTRWSREAPRLGTVRPMHECRLLRRERVIFRMSYPSSLSRAASALLLMSLAGCQPTSTPPGADAGPTNDAAGPVDGRVPDAAPSTTPTVTSVAPSSGASEIPLNASASATFSEAMDATTLTGATFTLSFGDPATAVEGTVIYAHETATFWPAQRLASDTMYTATITTGAESAYGRPLAE